jgi:hypothetical protein
MWWDRNAWVSFWGSDKGRGGGGVWGVRGISESSDDEDDEVWGCCLESALRGSMVYVPVSQIRREPVFGEADSMRWFCGMSVMRD